MLQKDLQRVLLEIFQSILEIFQEYFLEILQQFVLKSCGNPSKASFENLLFSRNPSEVPCDNPSVAVQELLLGIFQEDHLETIAGMPKGSSEGLPGETPYGVYNGICRILPIFFRSKDWRLSEWFERVNIRYGLAKAKTKNN